MLYLILFAAFLLPPAGVAAVAQENKSPDVEAEQTKDSGEKSDKADTKKKGKSADKKKSSRQGPVKDGSAAPKKNTGKKQKSDSVAPLTEYDLPDDVQYKDDFTKTLPTPKIRSPIFYFGRVVFSLILVIALIIGSVYVLKYVYNRSMRLDGKAHQISVLDVVQLGVNRNLYLVKVGEKVVLLGTGDKGLTYLADATDAVNLEELQLGEDVPAAPGINFGRQLNQALGFKKKTQSPGPQDAGTQFNSRLKDRLNKLEDDDSRET